VDRVQLLILLGSLQMAARSGQVGVGALALTTLATCCLHALSLALNIRNAEANRLAAEVASLAGETKTDAVIRALKERLQRLHRERQLTANDRSSLVNRLDQIALRCASRPMADQRSADEILGYDALGLPS